MRVNGDIPPAGRPGRTGPPIPESPPADGRAGAASHPVAPALGDHYQGTGTPTAANALTDIEREILNLIPEGLRPEEIAYRLAIRTHAVWGYLSSIGRKLGSADAGRRSLVLVAVHDALLPRGAIAAFDENSALRLSPDQLELLTLLAQGRTRTEIAASRGVSRTTIIRTVSGLFDQLRIPQSRDVAPLIEAATSLGLLPENGYSSFLAIREQAREEAAARAASSPTAGQREMIDSLLEGRTPEEIAEQRGIALTAVNEQLLRLSKLLGLPDRQLIPLVEGLRDRGFVTQADAGRFIALETERQRVAEEARAAREAARANAVTVTPAEQETLELTALGLNTREIAERKGLTTHKGVQRIKTLLGRGLGAVDNSDRELLLAAIRHGFLLPAAIETFDAAVATKPTIRLTAEQGALLEMLIAGRSRAEIGEARGISDTSAGLAIGYLCNKLGVEGRDVPALIQAAIDCRVVPPGSLETYRENLRLAEEAATTTAAQAAERLAPPQQEILGLLVDGLTYQEIADRRGTGVPAVEAQLRDLRKRLGVESTDPIPLVEAAAEAGFVDAADAVRYAEAERRRRDETVEIRPLTETQRTVLDSFVLDLYPNQVERRSGMSQGTFSTTMRMFRTLFQTEDREEMIAAAIARSLLEPAAMDRFRANRRRSDQELLRLLLSEMTIFQAALRRDEDSRNVNHRLQRLAGELSAPSAELRDLAPAAVGAGLLRESELEPLKDPLFGHRLADFLRELLRDIALTDTLGRLARRRGVELNSIHQYLRLLHGAYGTQTVSALIEGAAERGVLSQSDLQVFRINHAHVSRLILSSLAGTLPYYEVCDQLEIPASDFHARVEALYDELGVTTGNMLGLMNRAVQLQLLDPVVRDLFAEGYSEDGLLRRSETILVRLLAEGLTPLEAEARIGPGHTPFSTHMAALRGKLQIQSWEEIVPRVHELGLVDDAHLRHFQTTHRELERAVLRALAQGRPRGELSSRLTVHQSRWILDRLSHQLGASSWFELIPIALRRQRLLAEDLPDPQRPLAAVLSAEQYRVLEGLIVGEPVAEIAKDVGGVPLNVYSRLKYLRQLTGARRTDQLIARCVDLQLLSTGDLKRYRRRVDRKVEMELGALQLPEPRNDTELGATERKLLELLSYGLKKNELLDQVIQERGPTGDFLRDQLSDSLAALMTRLGARSYAHAAFLGIRLGLSSWRLAEGGIEKRPSENSLSATLTPELQYLLIGTALGVDLRVLSGRIDWTKRQATVAMGDLRRLLDVASDWQVIVAANRAELLPWDRLAPRERLTPRRRAGTPQQRRSSS